MPTDPPEMSDAEKLERWPGYDEQSWQERFDTLDRRYSESAATIAATAQWAEGQVALNQRAEARIAELEAENARLREESRGHRKVIAAMSDAIDEADNIIAVSVGTDTPRSWHAAIRKVQRARQSRGEPK